MLMQIAIARDGFIDAKENPNFAQSDNFLECLQKIFNFEEKDLYDFDGNTCRLINSYNPTNSIFIYTNQQGTFLYQITSATPYIHKNNMIWNCQTYKMEDLSKIDEVINNNFTQAVVYKNIAPYVPFESDANNQNNKANTPLYVVNVKDNFKTQSIFKYNMVYSKVCCLKLKFLVNPTTDTTLQTEETDGSFNFFFPFFCGVSEQTADDLFPLREPTYQIADEDTPNFYLSIYDIISKYSENLKTIEILPFNPFASLGADVSITGTAGNTTSIKVNSGAKFTDAGIFVRYGHSINRLAEDFITGTVSIDALEGKILLGGGARGVVKTPLATLNVDFNSFRLTNPDGFYYLIKSDGWKIDGIFEVDVPPHYLNFYTDNAGQVFIQNMTTNAQELRSITRNTNAKFEDLQQNYALKQIQNTTGIASGVVSGLASGNYLNALTSIGKGISQAGNLALENEFNKAQIQRDYNRSLVEYDDKIQTQSLLAKMTGKQISGNSLLSDLVTNFSADDFTITIELNSDFKWFWNEDGTLIFKSITPQIDYDYSTQFLKNNEGALGNYTDLTLNKTNKTFNNIYTYTYQLLSNLFGFTDNENFTKVNYYDSIGLNYNVVFKLKQMFYEEPQNGEFTERKKLIETKILNIPIRHATRLYV